MWRRSRFANLIRDLARRNIKFSPALLCLARRNFIVEIYQVPIYLLPVVLQQCKVKKKNNEVVGELARAAAEFCFSSLRLGSLPPSLPIHGDLLITRRNFHGTFPNLSRWFIVSLGFFSAFVAGELSIFFFAERAAPLPTPTPLRSQQHDGKKYNKYTEKIAAAKSFYLGFENTQFSS